MTCTTAERVLRKDVLAKMPGHTFVHCEEKACSYHASGRCKAIRIEMCIDKEHGLYCNTYVDYELEEYCPFSDEEQEGWYR